MIKLIDVQTLVGKAFMVPRDEQPKRGPRPLPIMILSISQKGDSVVWFDVEMLDWAGNVFWDHKISSWFNCREFF